MQASLKIKGQQLAASTAETQALRAELQSKDQELDQIQRIVAGFVVGMKGEGPQPVMKRYRPQGFSQRQTPRRTGVDGLRNL